MVIENYPIDLQWDPIDPSLILIVFFISDSPSLSICVLERENMCFLQSGFCSIHLKKKKNVIKPKDPVYCIPLSCSHIKQTNPMGNLFAVKTPSYVFIHLFVCFIV